MSWAYPHDPFADHPSRVSHVRTILDALSPCRLNRDSSIRNLNFELELRTGSNCRGINLNLDSADAAHTFLECTEVSRHFSTDFRTGVESWKLRLSESVGRITSLNVETRFVALNARIEAGRAGGVSGRAFDVVAQAIQDISKRTGEVAENLSDEFHDLLKEMREITQELAIRTRGERLSDLALTNIDLIDRNLYERSCDVRWWATDQSFVDALVHPTRETLAHASKRMGQILDSYTVYFDIALIDLNGRVLANGRPELFRFGRDRSMPSQSWFVAALRTAGWDAQYVQSEVGQTSLCSDERTMVFACTVRSDGRADGTPLGVLAIVFRWDALAQTIVERTPLSPAEWERSRVCIVDSRGKLLADSAREFGCAILTLPGMERDPEIIPRLPHGHD